KSSGKVHSFGKRDHAIKRNPNMPVVVRGWLYKQDSSGMRLWKRKWFVLADYCLFYYKDSREETVLGSISLPSYVIAPVGPEDHISRKYAFKATHTGMLSYIYNKNSIIGSQAEHCGMRTYYFSADTQEDMNGWIRAMNQAALMQTHTAEREADKMEKQAVPQTNHVNSNKAYTQAEVPPKQERPLRPVGETLGFEKREEIRKESEDEERYGFRKDTLKDKNKMKSPATVVEVDSLFTEPVGSSRAQPVQRNGTLPSARPAEQNGNPVYKRGFVPRTDTEKHVQRKTNLSQVEHWVKLQKGESKSSSLPVSEQTLSRRTPTSQPQPSTENYQTLPKNSRQPSSSPPPESRNLPSDYKYAHDRVSHFRMSSEERKAHKEGTVWQLYEWQQRQQFKHGSPTAPIYIGAPDYVDSSALKVSLEAPRSISVPPSSSDIPPPGPPPKALSPRRPNTPAERVTVRPVSERPTADFPASGSPRRIQAHVSKTAHVDRRSMPPMGYMTHTVSAPSLHGKTVSGRDSFKDRSAKPVRIAESDVDHSYTWAKEAQHSYTWAKEAQHSYTWAKEAQHSYTWAKEAQHSYTWAKEAQHSYTWAKEAQHSYTWAKEAQHSYTWAKEAQHSYTWAKEAQHSYTWAKEAQHSYTWAKEAQHSYTWAKEAQHSYTWAKEAQHSYTWAKEAQHSYTWAKEAQHSYTWAKEAQHSIFNAKEAQHSYTWAKEAQHSYTWVMGWKREQEFDLQLLERALQGEHKGKEKSDDWLTVHAVPMKEADLEPQDYDLDISRELSKPDKVLIPERYVEMDPEEPLSLQEMEARHRKVERIKSILSKSSVQNVQPAVSLDAHDFTDLDSALQEQERIITMSYALASEASQKSKQVAGEAASQHCTAISVGYYNFISNLQLWAKVLHQD
ncbi:UNVERIFIED_CONTAM: hypothetical protein FKN15_025945, partial [Acipenser sinensis]